MRNAADLSAEDYERLSQEFAHAKVRYRKNNKNAWITLAVAYGCLGLSQLLGPASRQGSLIFLVGGFLAMLLALIQIRRLRCPYCRRSLLPPGGEYCELCGASRGSARSTLFLWTCAHCAKKRAPASGFSFRFCTHCGFRFKPGLKRQIFGFVDDPDPEAVDR